VIDEMLVNPAVGMFVVGVIAAGLFAAGGLVRWLLS
jgi:hypothetical protein